MPQTGEFMYISSAVLLINLELSTVLVCFLKKHLSRQLIPTGGTAEHNYPMQCMKGWFNASYLCHVRFSTNKASKQGSKNRIECRRLHWLLFLFDNQDLNTCRAENKLSQGDISVFPCPDYFQYIIFRLQNQNF